MTVPDTIVKSLQKRKEQNAFRTLSDKSRMADFSSNDFLGLARSVELQQSVEEAYAHIERNKLGSSGSRLLCGHSTYFDELEEKLAHIHKAEAALIFNSGYNANLSILSSVPQKGDTIIYDEKAHASIRDGARLSHANKFSFKHNNPQDLNNKLKKSSGNNYVIVESLYSMDGDFCNISPILKVCEQHNAHLIVDEAHSTGIYANGSGWCTELGIESKIFARVMTFGKAIGSFGACIVSSKSLKDYLINFARPFIYTTALPIYNLANISCAFDHLQKHPELKEKLQENITFFNSLFQNGNDSAIQSIVVPGNENVKRLALSLEEQGLDVRPILSPTVTEGEERLRVCLHTFNTTEEIEKLFHYSHRN